ncbi:MAG: SHOCT domain-containing protein [Prolixibacteraceae bacterium]|jgi:putative membrane protein
MHANSFMNGDMGWGMGFGWIVGLIVLIVFILIIIRSLKTDKEKSNLPTKTALDILNERYAKGEIDKSEYKEKKSNLGT